MSKSQKLDVWLDEMKDKNKIYENEINKMTAQGIEWSKSWAQKSKRTLECYLETSNKKKFKARWLRKYRSIFFSFP